MTLTQEKPANITTNKITTTTSTTTTNYDSTVRFSLTIQENYHFHLSDPTSEIYNRYKSDIENAVEDNSDRIPGYKFNSTRVIGFRPGSIIADFSLQLSNPSINFLNASDGIINYLKGKDYEFDDNPFAEIENANLRESYGPLFPGENMVLKCSGNITEWQFNGQRIFGASEVLNVTNITPDKNGVYGCVSTKSSVPFIQWENVDSIQPYPNIQASPDTLFQCEDGQNVTLLCCSSSEYDTEMVKVDDINMTLQEEGFDRCIYSYIIQNCVDSSGKVVFDCKLKNSKLEKFEYSSKRITLTFKRKGFDCSDETFGAGNEGDQAKGSCEVDEVGSVTAVCQGTEWKITKDTCVLRVIQQLENDSQDLTLKTLPTFMATLSNVTTTQERKITNSTGNIESIVNTLNNTANFTRNSPPITVEMMEDFLNASAIIVSNSTISAWYRLNNGKTTRNVSSTFLGAVEVMVKSLPKDASFKTGKSIIQLCQSVNLTFNETVEADPSAAISIPEEGNFTVTTVAFSTGYIFLPARNSSGYDSTLYNSINAAVVLVQVNGTISNISLSFDLINETLGNLQCVFWNFELFNGLGGWDSFGCELISHINNTVTCECNHTTSFSILMSPYIPPTLKLLLDFITYIGVGISLLSLIISLIIEAIVWKSMTRNDTSYMRHVCMVNVAVSLLIADIWFIIGAAVSDSEETSVGACTAATFFIHFFYLALFFWMLVSALLLFYRTVMVLSQMRRSTMLAIAFTLGYGAPLIISVVTVAATAGSGGYIREKQVCWLNWKKTKALLAFAIPALAIIAMNFVLMIVVLFKMMRRHVGDTTQNTDKHALVVIARCVTILTPLFGLTWGFGIGIMVWPGSEGLQIVFAVLNSLQGFFILVFGTLLDSKMRLALVERLQKPSSDSSGTRDTHFGISTSSMFDFFKGIRRRNMYHISGSAVTLGYGTSGTYSVTDSNINV
ncbi:hypothetical protein ACEWY4_021878 [Coilia grayii]|uniref:Uncharacterized protein n=1 Tax=Coilia grayii TaxID=363190 RepID=A0ABD1J699_9TELE